jgi:ASC-1-like (ASCH) protein
MAIIRKKVWPEYFNLIESGKKKFELRLDDFEILEGDTLILEEWDPKEEKYTGRKIERKAGYILKFKLNDFGQENLIKEKGMKIISLD